MKNTPSSPALPPLGEGSRSLSHREKARVRVRTFAIYLLLAILLYFALRNAPLQDIGKALKNLQLWQILILLGINVIIYLLITLRWWLIIHAEKKSISYFPLLVIRVAVRRWGVSRFRFYTWNANTA